MYSKEVRHCSISRFFMGVVSCYANSNHPCVDDHHCGISEGLPILYYKRRASIASALSRSCFSSERP